MTILWNKPSMVFLYFSRLLQIMTRKRFSSAFAHKQWAARSILFDREIRIHLGVDNIWLSTLHVGIRKSSGSFFKISMHSCARIERDIIIYEDDIVTFQFWAIYDSIRGALYRNACNVCGISFSLADKGKCEMM